MSGRILIIDGIATRRIYLGVQLRDAHYDVQQCGTLGDALERVRAEPPELIIVALTAPDTPCLEFCKSLRADPVTAHAPIIVTAQDLSAERRLAVLQAGATEVLTRPTDERLLLARIRSALRARSSAEELGLREDTRRALGFAESGTEFARAGNLAILAGDPALAERWKIAFGRLSNLQANLVDRDDVFLPETARTGAPDLFVISAIGPDREAALRLVTELRSRATSRLSAIVMVVAAKDVACAAMALDLGVDDLVLETACADELRLRVAAQLTRKRLQDRQRADLKTGLEAAVTDPLTGLYNRRYALPHLDRMAERARTADRSYAVMVLDIDHFKRVNDRFGHGAGDRVLRVIAETLRQNLRAVDLLARIGGEEFLIALPDCTETEAMSAAERLCDLIQSRTVTIGAADAEVRVTVSIGVAVGPPPPAASTSGTRQIGAVAQTDAQQMIERADGALYRSKTSGRNTVTVSSAAAA